MLELLAPAGDLKSFEAAINCGADAVYLGLSDFNARRKADNFDAENLGDIVNKAHFYGVKVYVAVNTLVHNCEMPELLSLVRSAVDAKADAFIVQDLGVARCLKEAFPGIVLHASTQLGVHNLYGARVAERAGFKRVVLSRETKLEDIRAIRAGTSLEIEYFIQGALCVAFSGNCYLSATEQSASGNRGLCKQLCRLPYKATVGEKSAEGFLLSAKDLCLADSLKELADAGVSSFKIEGRLRREGYVANAVCVYRKLIDGLGAEKMSETDRNRLRISYCRGGGYSERAYLDGGIPNIIEKEFNNHTGIEIGKVKAVTPFKTDLFKVTVTSSEPLYVGDGLKFFALSAENSKYSESNSVHGNGRNKSKKGDTEFKWREAASLGLGDVKPSGKGEYVFVTKTEIKCGWRVHLISSASQDNDVLSKTRKVAIIMSVKARVGEPLLIKVEADCGAEIEAEGTVCERAKTSPLSADDIRVQASKAGESGFDIVKCEVDTDGVFVPKSVLNALRRDAIERLARAIIYAEELPLVGIDENAIKHLTNSLNTSFDSLNIRFVHSDELNANCNFCRTKGVESEIIALCPDEYSVCEIERMSEILNVPRQQIALQLPVIANGKDLDLLEKLLARLPWLKMLVSENIYGFEFAKHGYEVIAGAGHNALNCFAKNACKSLGATSVLPSVESGERDGIRGEELPLMTFAHCPYKTVFGNDCADCSFREGMTVSRGPREYKVRRTKLHNCYFGLFN